MCQAEVTQLLVEWANGDEKALHSLIPLVYDELRKMASRQMAHERAGHTLQTHALVHEAYLRLVDQRSVHWRNRAHFFGVAGQAMRRILVDHARRKQVAKRGGGAPRIALSDCCELPLEQDDALIALDEALGDLAVADAELAKIVEMRFFGGLSVDEVAALLGHSTATIHRRWRVARAWLYRALASPDSQETR